MKRYLTTKEASEFLSVSPSFLHRRKGSTFKKGIHYFKPKNEKILRWDKLELDRWIRTDETTIDEIVKRLL